MAVVAIDGPAGSGKSTVARALAERLGVTHVDTGAYYRAATLAALESGTDIGDGDKLAALAARIVIERKDARTFLDGRDVSERIRATAVDEAVSAVAAHPQVRSVLVERQRAAIPVAGAVVEGRDAGTRIVPAAALKVWLTAAPEVRARRRAGDKVVASVLVDSAAVEQQNRALAERDRLDSANMGRADDVREIDTSSLDVDQVVERIVRLLEEPA